MSLKEFLKKEFSTKNEKSFINSSGFSGMVGTLAGLASNAIGGGYSSNAGDTFKTLAGAASAIPGPYGAALSGGLTAAGGLTNFLWGTKTNTEELNKAESGINAYNSYISNAKDFDNVADILTLLAFTDPFKGGVFKKGWARKLNENLRNRSIAALDFAYRGLVNNIDTIAGRQLRDAVSSAAYGGLLDMVDPVSAIGLLIYTDNYVTRNNKQNNYKINNILAGVPNNGFALGGVLQAYGGTWGNTTHVDAGGTHEDNPHQGVQMGVDSLGTPNLVELNELIWNDYVFSNRLTVPTDRRNKYAKGGKMNKKDSNNQISYEDKLLKPYAGLTFADAAKKAERLTGVNERPNDPIAQRGLEEILNVLMETQEKERALEQLEEMENAIKNMTPEEYAMLLQEMLSMQEQAAQLEALQQLQQMIPQGMELMQLIPEGQLPMYALGGLLDRWNMEPNILALGGTTNSTEDLEEAPSEPTPTNQKPEEPKESLKDSKTKKTILKLEHLNNLNYDLLARVMKVLNTEFTPLSDIHSMSKNDEELEIEKLKLEIIKRANPENKTKESTSLEELLEKLNTPNNSWRGWRRADINSTDEGWTKDYNWKEFLNRLKNYTSSKNAGNNSNTYTEDVNFPLEGAKNIKEYLDNSQSKLYTLNLIDAIKENSDKLFVVDNDGKLSIKDSNESVNPAILALYTTGQQTLTKDGPITLFEPVDNKGNTILLKGNAATRLLELRTDGKAGVYSLNPNTILTRKLYQVAGLNDYYLPETVENDLSNYTISSEPTTLGDGTEVYTLTPNNSTIEFALIAPESPTDKGKGNNTKKGNDGLPAPPEWPLYTALGILGLSLMNNLLSPIDYSLARKLEEAARQAGTYYPVNYTPVGERLKLKPLDTNYIVNQLQATHDRNARHILNSSLGNPGIALAGIILNSAANQQAIGDAYRKGEEYNNAQRQLEVTVNSNIDTLDSKGALEAAMANLRADLDAKKSLAALLDNAVKTELAIKGAKELAISANLSGITDLINSYGLNLWNDRLYRYGYNKGAFEDAKGGKLRKIRKGIGF